MSSSSTEKEQELEQALDEASRVAAVHARREYMTKLRGENPPYFVKSASVVVEQDKEEDKDKDKNNKKQKNQKKKEKAH